jgi:hypothetical protein
MIQKSPLPIIFILLLVILLAHLGAVFFNLYWQIFWYDSVVHFLAGFLMGMSYLWLTTHSSLRLKFQDSIQKNVFILLLFTFVVGIFWEIFEYFSGTTFAIGFYTIDALLDLFFGLVGAYLSFLYFFHKGYNKIDGKN